MLIPRARPSYGPFRNLETQQHDPVVGSKGRRAVCIEVRWEVSRDQIQGEPAQRLAKS